MSRQKDLDQFYELLDTLRQKLGGERLLSTCTGSQDWPRQGVYFFFEPGEHRGSSTEPRVVRVGTHAVARGARSTLWKRLRQHRGFLKGSFAGGGNHRGSVFRKHVGAAIIGRESRFSSLSCTWGKGHSAPIETRLAEHCLEQRVSGYIGSMPFLWLRVDDPAGPLSKRRSIEQNAIGLLSNAAKYQILDPPSPTWLGYMCPNPAINASGLWNIDGVYGGYDAAFLEELKARIANM